MGKQEIIEQLEKWVSAEDFEPNKTQFTDWKSEFEKERLQTEKQQETEAQKEGEGENDFEYTPTKEDLRFEELCGIYHDKRKQYESKRKAELENNLAEKKALIEELDSLIKDEENIGKAYSRFNAIKQKWNELGPVLANKRRGIQTEYSRLIELFYYNINIYRELQLNDLKKNQELKLEVIEKIKALKEEKSIHQLDFLIHQYLDEWDTIGPTFKEEWEKIREEFKEVVNVVFERLREHRKAVKTTHKNNLDKKQEIIAKAKEIAEPEILDHKSTQERTQRIIGLQKDWKKIGFAGHKHNDAVWKEFREVCDDYFNKRKVFIDKNSEKFAVLRSKKKGLIQRAKEIHTETQSAEVANELKNLQRQWKETDKLLPQEEYRLFREFRNYCDTYFKGKKQAAKELEKQWKANLKAKEELLEKFAKELKDKITVKGETLIEEWTKEWGASGEVASAAGTQVDKSFQSIVSKAYDALGISESERKEKEFASKIKTIANAGDPVKELKRERGFLNGKIKAAEVETRQLEDKLAFFKFSDDSNPLKKELLDRIEESKEKTAKIRAKRKKVDLLIKEQEAAESLDMSEEEAKSTEEA